MAVFFLIGGLVLLVLGAEGLVRGASSLAERVGISRIVLGLTVVAFGTSAPELAVSISSSLSGQADVALGNVVGSNIFNVLFILGVAALAAPLTVTARLVRIDVPLAILISGVTLLFALDGRISRTDGLLLIGGLIVYTAVLIVQSRFSSEASSVSDSSASKASAFVAFTSGEEADSVREDTSSRKSSQTARWAWNLGLVAGGLALLVLGARWFVGAAVEISRSLGVSELVIGLTIIAGGTSLPELATSVLAGLRGERDIAVGNVVGSNIFNLLAVLGISATVSSGGIPVSEAILWFDLPVMITTAIACLPIFFTGFAIARWEGLLFVGYYGAYTAYLILGATQHEALSTFSVAMGAFVLPLTIVTLGVLVIRTWRTSSPDE